MMEKKKSAHFQSFVSGIWKENPLFVSLLGLCPALAVTKSLEAAFGMGILFTIVLVCSNVLVSALRKVIPDEAKTPCEIVIIATFVTLVKMLTEAMLPELYSTLGVFLSLLVVNCIVLGRSEAFAVKNGVVDSLLDGLGNGIGYTIAICIIALLREVLGTGMLTFGETFTFLGGPHHLYILTGPSATPVAQPAWDLSLSFFQTPGGAFLVLGIILAVLAAIRNCKAEKAKVDARLKKAAEAAASKGNPTPSQGGQSK